MSLYRFKPWLAAWACVFLMGAPAFAQEVPNSQLPDGQLLDPHPPGQFGGGVAPNEGYFFTYDALNLFISHPAVTSIGAPGLTRQVFFAPSKSTVQSNSLDTSFLGNDWVWGSRFEIGDIVEHCGWMLGYYNMRVQSQMRDFEGVVMTIDDREFGPANQRHLDGWLAELDAAGDTVFSATPLPLPLSFDTMHVENIVDTWSVEWMFMYRTHPLGFYRSTLAEMYFGVRYLEFEDRFHVQGRGVRLRNQGGDFAEPATILSDSDWRNDAFNRVVGPQLGLRLFTRRGRWTFSAEGRFLAGFNFQTVRQRGVLGTHLNEVPTTGDGGTIATGPGNIISGIPAAIGPTYFTHGFDANEFSPCVEFRADARVHITRGLAFRAGYTAVWIDGLARGSDMIDYVWSETTVFGIRQDTNRQAVFMNGLSLGLEFNR